MAVFVIGDLHLSFKNPKPMNIFGNNWDNHEEKIKNDWLKKVKEEDTVMLIGDFSWAMKIQDAYLDFKYLEELPGKKILLKGNHDYWWTTITSMRKYLSENGFKTIDFLFNNNFEIENKIFVGTRGWTLGESAEERKMLEREAQRFELSINDNKQKVGESKKEIIALFHYPPITKIQKSRNEMNEFIKIMKKNNINRCYYGHLHGNGIRDGLNENIFGIEFRLISCDSNNFELLEIN